MHRTHLLRVFLGLALAALVVACSPSAPQSQAPAAAPTAASAAKAQPTTAPAAPAQPTAAPAQPTAAPAAKAQATTAPAAPAAAAQPTQFIFAHPGPIASMDAPVTWFGATHWLTNGLYDCLIWRKADGSGYVGQAAERWETIDPVTWRFHLRPNLKFQNGEPLDAAAVKWNIDRTRTRKDFMVQPQWLFIQDVKVVDAKTVDVITTKPHAYTEYDISYNGCELLPPKYLEQIGEKEFAKKPVGSGPFKLVEFTENQRYVFEAWDGYWAGKPGVDRVIYQVIPERSTQIAALLAGQVDFVPNIPIPDRKKLEGQSGLKLLTAPANRQHLLYLRNDADAGKLKETHPGYQPVTSDKRVRQAVNYALDRKLLAEIQGSARPSLLRVDVANPEHAGRWSGEEAAVKFYNPAKAKELLAQAGYTAAKKPVVHLDAMNLQEGNEKEVAEAIEVMLEDVGFDVKLNVLDAAAYREQILTPGNNRELALVVIGGAASLIPVFYQCSWKAANWSPCPVVKGEWEQLGQNIMQETNTTARLKLWEKFWDFYVDEPVEATLYHMNNVMAMNAKFEWTPRADGWFTFRDLKVKK
jgi:peptide/nickel transport system substrate-binding protein